MSSVPLVSGENREERAAPPVEDKFTAADCVRITFIAIGVILTLIGVFSLLSSDELNVMKTFLSGVGVGGSAAMLSVGFVTTVVAYCCRKKTAAEIAREEEDRAVHQEVIRKRERCLQDCDKTIRAEMGIPEDRSAPRTEYTYARLFRWIKGNDTNKVEFTSQDVYHDLTFSTHIDWQREQCTHVHVEHLLIAKDASGKWTIQWGSMNMMEGSMDPKITTKKGLSGDACLLEVSEIEKALTLRGDLNISKTITDYVAHVGYSEVRSEAIRYVDSRVGQLLTELNQHKELTTVRFYYAAKGTRSSAYSWKDEHAYHYYGRHLPENKDWNGFGSIKYLLDQIPIEERVALECLVLAESADGRYHLIEVTNASLTSNYILTDIVKIPTLQFIQSQLLSSMPLTRTHFTEKEVNTFVEFMPAHKRREALEEGLRAEIAGRVKSMVNLDVLDIYYGAVGANGKTSAINNVYRDESRIPHSKDEIGLPYEIRAENDNMPESIKGIRYEFVIIGRTNKGAAYHISSGSFDARKENTIPIIVQGVTQHNVQKADLANEIAAAKKACPLFHARLDKSEVEGMLFQHKVYEDNRNN